MKIWHFLLRPPALTETFLCDSLGLMPDCEEELVVLRTKPMLTERIPSIPIRMTGPLGLFFERSCPDVLVVHYLSHALLAIPWKLWFRVPLVVCTYGFDISEFPKRPMSRLLLPLLRRLVTQLWVMSDWQQKRALQAGFHTDRIRVLPPGIRNQKLKVYQAKPAPHLLMIASLKEKKNHLFSLQVLARLPSKYRLRIVGEGAEENRIRAFAKLLKVEHRVEFETSFTQASELKRHFEWAGYLMHPSAPSKNGDEEGIPTIMLQAMQSGLAVLSLSHFGLPDVFGDGVWFGPDEPKAFAREFLKMSPDLFRQQIEKAYLQVASLDAQICANRRREVLSLL